MSDKLLTILQTCALFSVSRRTVYNWIAAGRLKTCRTPGGALRIYEASALKANDYRPAPTHGAMPMPASAEVTPAE